MCETSYSGSCVAKAVQPVSPFQANSKVAVTMVKKVQVKVEANTNPGETVMLCGSTKELGEWHVDKSLPLTQEERTAIWSADIPVDESGPVEFRYLICILLELDISTCIDHDNNEKKVPRKLVIVRRWETNISPRILHPNTQNGDLHVFGDYGKYRTID